MNPDPPKTRVTYPYSTIVILIAIFYALIAAGVSRAQTLGAFDAAGYPVTAHTMNRWKRRRDSGDLVSGLSKRGRRQLLSPDQIDLVVGFVLSQNKDKRPVSRRLAAEFCLREFNIEMDERTVGRYFNRGGLRRRLANKRATGRASLDEQTRLYKDFLRNMPRQVRSGNTVFGSFDFTYDSHATNSQSTWAPKGAKQPNVQLKMNPYTNCYATLLYSNGQQSPCLCFTYCKDFNFKRGQSAAAVQHNNRLRALLAEYNIDHNRIKVIPVPRGKSTKYAKEDAGMVKQMLDAYEIDCEFMHTDNGNAFKRDGEDVVEELGFTRFTAAPAIHQYVSPNDNLFHGARKKIWRASTTDFSDPIRSALSLMKTFDDAELSTVKDYFTKNFFLDNRRPSDAEIGKVIGTGIETNHAYFAECFIKYRRDVLGENIDETELVNGLDGEYWN